MYVDAVLINTQALERADRNDQIISETNRRPVRPVAPTGKTGRANRSDRLGAKNPAKPRTSSSGGTPSELEDPGLSWSRQATQDALECHKDEQRTTQRLKKLGFEEKVKVN